MLPLDSRCIRAGFNPISVQVCHNDLRVEDQAKDQEGGQHAKDPRGVDLIFVEDRHVLGSVQLESKCWFTLHKEIGLTIS